MGEQCWKVLIVMYCPNCNSINQWSDMFNEGSEAEYTTQCHSCGKQILFTAGVKVKNKEAE